MASRRRLRRKALTSCHRKLHHETETAAVAHLISLRRLNRSRGDFHPINAYKCPACGRGWIVGHRPVKNTNRRKFMHD